jgi:hypothetical protein
MLDEHTLAAYLDGYERAAVERAILAHRATLEMTQAVPLQIAA